MSLYRTSEFDSVSLFVRGLDAAFGTDLQYHGVPVLRTAAAVIDPGKKFPHLFRDLFRQGNGQILTP